jgi:hypothetical protein
MIAHRAVRLLYLMDVTVFGWFVGGMTIRRILA